MTVYAYYELTNTFLAPKTEGLVVNAKNIPGNKLPLSQVKTEANDIASKGSNPSASQYYSKYKDWMENDSYHLYTLLRSSGGAYLSPNSANNWLELRIINVGQHDGDGSGLTFEAVHCLTRALPMFQGSSSLSGSSYLRSESYNWSKSYIFRYLNNDFLNSLSSDLADNILAIPKRHIATAEYVNSTNKVMTTSSKLWLLSNGEKKLSDYFGGNVPYMFYNLYNSDKTYFSFGATPLDYQNNWISRAKLRTRDSATLTASFDGGTYTVDSNWSRDIRTKSGSTNDLLGFGVESLGFLTYPGSSSSEIGRSVVQPLAVVPAFAL